MVRWIDETIHDGWGLRLRADRVLYEQQTEHQHLIIFENEAFGRVLVLDDAIQLTTADEFIYHEMLSHVPLFALDEPRNVLIIGGGDGGVMREVLKHQGVEKVTLCEIDRAVIDTALQHFPEISAGAFDDPRADVVIADGTTFVAETSQRFDAILVDSTDPIGPSTVLFAKEFYGRCKTCLKPGGVLVTQNGVPFVQGDELSASANFFRQLAFNDVSAYLATTPTYSGGPLAYGWAARDTGLRTTSLKMLQSRFNAAHMTTKYYSPEVHVASFALPPYVAQLLDA